MRHQATLDRCLEGRPQEGALGAHLQRVPSLPTGSFAAPVHRMPARSRAHSVTHHRLEGNERLGDSVVPGRRHATRVTNQRSGPDVAAALLCGQYRHSDEKPRLPIMASGWRLSRAKRPAATVNATPPFTPRRSFVCLRRRAALDGFLRFLHIDGPPRSGFAGWLRGGPISLPRGCRGRATTGEVGGQLLTEKQPSRCVPALARHRSCSGRLVGRCRRWRGSRRRARAVLCRPGRRRIGSYNPGSCR
jgi:hypothetical protein